MRSAHTCAFRAARWAMAGSVAENMRRMEPATVRSNGVSHVYCQKRLMISRGIDDKERTMPTKSTSASNSASGAASSLPRGAKTSSKYLGVFEMSSKNMNQEMETKVPLFMYFMVPNHPDVRKFSELLTLQVDQTNRRLKDSNLGEAYQEFGPDSGLAIKLGMVDCLKEPQLREKFAVDPHVFPVIYFIRNKSLVDKLAGIVPESQVKEAIEAFIDYAKTETKNEMEGNTAVNKMKREDNDDENAVTLMQVAIKELQKKDIGKAKQLYSKALDMSMRDVDVVEKRLGVKSKKLTREMWNRMKRELCYNTAPQALCGLGMCAMASKNIEEAGRMAARVRADFPYAVSDLREVAEAVTRIEMLILTDFDMEKDNYLTLLKYAELNSDPVQFYQNRLKLVVALMMEGSHSAAVEEALRVVRAEPKLLPELKKAGIIEENLVLGPTATTPGRKLILKVFESLGSMNEHAVKGRQLYQLYT